MPTSLRWAVLAFAMTLSGRALANSPPDLVRLKNGGMVRGSILELVPDSFVVVELKNGETRRFEMSEVEYAGPEDRFEPARPTESPSPEPTARESEKADAEQEDDESQIGRTKPGKRAAPEREPRRTLARVGKFSARSRCARTRRT